MLKALLERIESLAVPFLVFHREIRGSSNRTAHKYQDTRIGDWIRQNGAKMVFAREVGDRVLFMEQGEIVEEGSPEQLFGNPVQDRTQSFLSKVL